MIDFSTLPLWATIAKRVITVLILAAFGVHAYVQYRRRGKLLAPERWLYLSFSIVLLFAVVVNSVMAVIAAKTDLRQGPFNTGIFSLLVFILYLIFAGGAMRRARF